MHTTRHVLSRFFTNGLPDGPRNPPGRRAKARRGPLMGTASALGAQQASCHTKRMEDQGACNGSTREGPRPTLYRWRRAVPEPARHGKDGTPRQDAGWSRYRRHCVPAQNLCGLPRRKRKAAASARGSCRTGGSGMRSSGYYPGVSTGVCRACRTRTPAAEYAPLRRGAPQGGPKRLGTRRFRTDG